MAADAVAGRRSDLSTLADGTWDVVIVGGGIVGSGALLDAVSRGMRAALIEQDDIASGTSSRSSRLIHGGLRYLEQFRFGLVREALAERSRLLDLAPHLVRLEPLLFPIYGIPFASKAFYDAGLTLYDILGARHDGGWHRRLSRGATLELAPTLRADGLRGGLVYHDGVEDDARYTLAVARTAVVAGGTAVTRVRATGLRPGTTAGSVEAVLARDVLTGTDLEIRTAAVVDATGVWEANADHPFGGGSLRILPSRGAHLVVPRARIPNAVGLTIRVPGKIVFLVPWPEHWLIGTTDAPYEGPTEEPAAGGWEVTHLLDTVNATMDVDLRREDVVGTYAGLRPLIAPSDGPTVKASREHRVSVEANGVVRIGGGKYTTYRVMARDVIDAVLGAEIAKARPSRTADHRLVGAADRDQLDRLAADLGAGADLGAVSPGAAERLVARHGSEAPDVLEFGRSLGLVRPLVDGRPFIEAEVPWAARRELALSIDDVLARRTRLSQELPDRGAAVAPRVADLLGDVLGWDDARRGREVEAYLASARRQYSVAPPEEPAPVPASTGPRPSSPRHAAAPAYASMGFIGDVGRDLFGAFYDWRLAVLAGSVIGGSAILGLAVRRGWFPAARRHPGRTGAVVAFVLAIGLPLTWYLASPIFLRTALVEAEDAVPVVGPAASPDRAAVPTPAASASAAATTASSETATPAPTPALFQPAIVATGTFHGSDDFHFGEGTATIVETTPGRYRLRFADFSVRNGPDLYVYLSPSADGYADGSLELGRLKATDGAFGYDLPAGTDPADFASAVVWCKQFSHLFATAPLADA